jgi:hypothetical protein
MSNCETCNDSEANQVRDHDGSTRLLCSDCERNDYICVGCHVDLRDTDHECACQVGNE